MAEFITKKIVDDLGLSLDYEIVSRATSGEEYGNTIYPPAARELYRRGIPFDSRRESTLISPDEYDKYDIIALMDERNIRNIKRYFPADPDKKISKLMSFTGSSRDVSDPWYSGDFKTAFDDIYSGCVSLLCNIDERVTEEKIAALSKIVMP